IHQQTSVARTPEQNGVVERWNRILVEAARTMLSAANVPLFFWDKAIATTCFTQNRSLVIPRHEKTPYHIINDIEESLESKYMAEDASSKKFLVSNFMNYKMVDTRPIMEQFHEMLRILGHHIRIEKGIDCIFIGYAENSKCYRFYVIEPNDYVSVNSIIESRDAIFDEE
nr:hypothetical protein [Tanacetum cinerariifolium]